MQYSIIFALATAAAVSAGGVTSVITPTGAAPAGCTASVSGNFEITVVKPTVAKRDLEKRGACGGDGTLVISLADGKLTDAKGRTGYIASNFQFQFDGPPQAGAIYTAGFSVCGNESLALGPSTVFYQCRSGGFFNLYNENWAPQCEAVAIDIIPCGGSAAPAPAGSPAAQSPDGQPTAAPATQITDGQPQAGAATPVAQITDGQPQAASAVPVSQFTDGQPQVIPSSPPTAAPVAASPAPAVVSQITDGQPQAAGNATAPPSVAPVAPTVAPFKGAGSMLSVGAGFVAAAAGLVGVALL